MNKLFIFIVSFFIFCFGLIGIQNGFSQWITYYLPYGGLANEIEFYNLNTGVSCGHSILQFSEKIFYTTNSGTNWIQANYPAELRALLTVQFIDASTVYACGAKNSMSFNPTNNIFRLQNYNFYKSGFYINGISDKHEYYKGIFIKSTNAGASWIEVGKLDTLTGYVEDMQFFNVNTGYAVIDTNPSGYPKFCKTTNAGLNWQCIARLDSHLITNDMNFIDINTGFICGTTLFNEQGYSRIYKTTNGGINWSVKDFTGRVNFMGMCFFNSTTGIAIGNHSEAFVGTKIFRTTNTGTSWDSIATFYNIISQFVKNLKGTGTAFASGFYYLNDTNNLTFTKTYTFKSTNYGLNWITRYFNSNNLITGCTLIDQNNFFISGGNLYDTAVIMKSTNGGNVFVNQIGNEIPTTFKLFQNYPNPFNPTTSIKYQVAGIKHIKLIIYDILGKEIATLVNGKQSLGIYEIIFDASSYPSGVYFYTLETQGYKETKKMILLK